MTGAAVHRRGEVDISPLLFGTILFLASELLFFGGLFAAYFNLRADTTPWPPAGVELELVPADDRHAPARRVELHLPGRRRRGSSIRARCEGGRSRRSRSASHSSTIQLFDWLQLDFGVSSHAYGTMFYSMTGFHGLHVVAGVLLMLVVLGRVMQGAYRDGNVDGAEAIAYYWHFVDVVWIALFATIFLLR